MKEKRPNIIRRFENRTLAISSNTLFIFACILTSLGIVCLCLVIGFLVVWWATS